MILHITLQVILQVTAGDTVYDTTGDTEDDTAGNMLTDRSLRYPQTDPVSDRCKVVEAPSGQDGQQDAGQDCLDRGSGHLGHRVSGREDWIGLALGSGVKER